MTGNGKRRKVSSVLVRRGNGDFQTLRVNKALIVAGGAIASSRFLMRSGVGGSFVGKGLSCNYAFPILVEFDERIDAFDGLQMTLFAAPENHEMVFETAFNPPGMQSIMAQQYFSDHQRMMNAYRNAMVVIALVGSDPTGFVSRRRSLILGRAVQWKQTGDEIQRIKHALSTGVRIAREAGAIHVRLPMHPVLEIPLDSSMESTLGLFNATINDKKYFQFATPHPQGGNMIAANSFNERVVDTDFRVYDCANLFVCDASVFPRGVRVNPQWTIMALASVAGDRIAAQT